MMLLVLFLSSVLAMDVSCSSSGAPCSDFLIASTPKAKERFIVVTLLVEPEEAAYNDYDVYKDISRLTIQNMQSYASANGYDFRVFRGSEKMSHKPAQQRKNFHVHTEAEALVHTAAQSKDESTQPYWKKIDALRAVAAKNTSHSWILYTDVDVLFLRRNPLSAFLSGSEDKLFVGVGECMHPLVPRSGFFFLRNDHRTLPFLDKWKSMFPKYMHAENPEQLALEEMLSDRSDVKVLDWASFHSYDICPAWLRAFSVHIPGHFKETRTARAFLLQRLLDGSIKHDDPLVLHAIRLLKTIQADAAVIPSVPSGAITECLAAIGADQKLVDIQSELRAACQVSTSREKRMFDNIIHVQGSSAHDWMKLNTPAFLGLVYSADDMKRVTEICFETDLSWLWQAASESIRTKLWRLCSVFLFGGFAVEGNDAMDLSELNAAFGDLGHTDNGVYFGSPLNFVANVLVSRIKQPLLAQNRNKKFNEGELLSLLDFKAVNDVSQRYSCYDFACRGKDVYSKLRAATPCITFTFNGCTSVQMLGNIGNGNCFLLPTYAYLKSNPATLTLTSKNLPRLRGQTVKFGTCNASASHLFEPICGQQFVTSC